MNPEKLRSDEDAVSEIVGAKLFWVYANRERSFYVLPLGGAFTLVISANSTPGECHVATREVSSWEFAQHVMASGHRQAADRVSLREISVSLAVDEYLAIQKVAVSLHESGSASKFKEALASVPKRKWLPFGGPVGWPSRDENLTI